MEKEKWKKYLKPEEMPTPCKRCKFRNQLRWLLGVIFCDHSSYTSVNRKKPCDEFKGDYGVQLELFA
jgi:hypothetical protein